MNKIDMNIIILGGNSDIGRELSIRFERGGHRCFRIYRKDKLPHVRWDLVVVCIGLLEPIGDFFDIKWHEWEYCLDVNTLLPLRLLRRIWGRHNHGASVCFFSGAGTSNSARTYSAYSASKIMLFKMTELLDDESPDVKFFILGPGMVRTKIQQQTLAAGERAANIERVRKFMTEGDPLHGTGTSHDRIYACLRWCMSLPKATIGGRNIYVPDEFGLELAAKLAADPRYFKLRRKE